LRKALKAFAKYISRMNQYTKDEEEQIEYVLRIIVFEALKIIGVIATFSVIGYPIQVIIAMLTMITSKPFIGGLHEDNQIKCFIATSIIIGSVIYLSTNLEIDMISKLILSVASLYCIWHQAPVINPIMQLTKPELIKRNRTLGIFIVTIFIIISVLLHKYKSVSNTMLWTIVFQALLMFNKRSNTKSLQGI
jgi:accessory gene regulator B